WHVQEYRVSKASRATSMAGVGFDAFGWELFPYLSSGASVLLVNNEDRLSLGRLGDLFCQEGITHSFVATAMLWDLVRELSTRCTSLEYLLTGGDRLAGANPGRLSYKLVNNYGPTENTVVASNYILEPESGSYSSPSIG
ncbi:AMP-binding protein, partial [Dyadobacter sp. OTU695]|uniref:AMP-binding protein n=1 Tax=Dyadobacter sp. OTU695 TaxID=3043860 RepID=UPI00313C2D74